MTTIIISSQKCRPGRPKYTKQTTPVQKEQTPFYPFINSLVLEMDI